MKPCASENPVTSLQAEAFSLRGARFLTLVVLLLVAACIAVANISSTPLTVNNVGKALQAAVVERPYGWPVPWYWRSPVVRPLPATNPIPIQWTWSRYSPAYLAADVALWLVILLVVSLCGEWLVRRYRSRLPWRPRAVTVFALLLATAITVLANLSSDIGPRQPQPHSCGWPLIWYWQTYVDILWQSFSEWHFNAAALAGNCVIWAALLTVIALGCEELVRRYQPRLRWSLRTMLAGVALVAALCAWFVNERKRVEDEDVLIAQVQPDHGMVFLEGKGPAWLDLVGAARLRRHVAGVYVRDLTRQVGEVELYKRIARFPHLRYLEVRLELIPDVEPVLAEMRQLRTLGIRCRMYKPEYQLATLAAVGKLTELERLSVEVGLAGTGDLDPLAALTNLKSLTLEIRGNIDPHGGLAVLGKLPRLEQLALTTGQISRVDLASLASLTNLKSLLIQCTPGGAAPLPALPRLEALDLSHVSLSDADLARLAACPRLKLLCLGETGVSAAGLAGLASAPSLRELAIDEDALTVEGLESLAALKNLKSLHVAHLMADHQDDDDYAEVVLDDGQNLNVPSSALDRLRRAIASLRRACPGIVIDTDYNGFEEREFRRVRELEPPQGSEPAL
jgi:hypothetical protein